MALMDLNERLQKYSDELFFGKWKLDGATPDEALLGKGKFGRVYAVYCEEMDRTGHLARYSSAIKLIAIDEQNLSLSPNASREEAAGEAQGRTGYLPARDRDHEEARGREATSPTFRTARSFRARTRSCRAGTC